MSQFGELLKEAFVDTEPFDPNPDKEAVEASVRKFTRRMKTIRWMAIVAVSFMTAVFVWAAVSFVSASVDTATKTLLLYFGAAMFGMVGIAFSKTWFALMLNHVALMKELKRIQLMMLEQNARGADQG